MSILTWRRDSLDRMAAYEQAEEIRWVFREACRGAQVGIPVDNPIAGTAWSAPRVTSVSLGPPLRLRVQMPPGTEPAQLRRAGRLIAPHLYGRVLRVTDLGNAWCQVTVITRDPLDDPLPLNLSEPGLLLGRAEDGDLVELDHPRDLPHVIVQGQTRSGKSIFVYSLIAQCLREPDVLVCGVDPSGITLRPLSGRPWVVNGLSDPDGIVNTLTALVCEMDDRLAAMPADRDILPTGPDVPVVVLVLDEYPALLRALDGLKSKDNDPGKIVRTLVARMLAESHKVGFRVVLIAQRAEASIVGAAERAQCAGRLSFRVDSPDSIKLLHPDGADLAGEHTSAPPGIGLLSWPGQPLRRVRGPLIGTYQDYVAAVGSQEPPAPRLRAV